MRTLLDFEGLILNVLFRLLHILRAEVEAIGGAFSFPLPPIEALQDAADAACVAGVDAAGFKLEAVSRHVADADLVFAELVEVLRDDRLPCVGLESRVLLGGDVFALEFLVRPPGRLVSVEADSFGEQLVRLFPYAHKASGIVRLCA